MSEILDERRAEGIVHALTGQDSCNCSDCGEEVDVSDATDPMAVVLRLEEHRKTHAGNTTHRTNSGDDSA